MIVELTASRALVHYDGWASRWDEWLAIDSGRIVKRGEGADRDGSGVGKDSEASGKRKGKGSSSSGSTASSTEADEVEWFYCTRRVSTSATSTAPEDDWLPHSSLNNSKLEQAYLALVNSPTASTSSSSPSSAATLQLSLRTARHSFDVDISSMTQVDSHTGQLFYLKRRSIVDQQSFSFLEDVQWAVTGSQLLCVLPALCSPNATRRPVLRLFELSAGESCDMRWLADVRLFSAQARSLPSSLASAFTHASHQLDAQLSSVCFDPSNNELLSYHSSEQIIRRWRNAGPSSTQRASSASGAADVTVGQVRATTVSCDDLDVQPPPCFAADGIVLSTPLSLSARLLAHVSDFCQYFSPAASSTPPLLEPFCVDVHQASFSHLYRLLSHCWQRLGSADAAAAASLLSCCDSLLRLLKANLLHLPLSTVYPSSWLSVLNSISDVLTDLSSSSFTSLRVLSDDCLLAGFSAFFPSASSLVPFLRRRLAAHSFRQRLLDEMSSSDRLMLLFSPDGSGSEQLSSLLSACLDACEQDARVALMAVADDGDPSSAPQRAESESAWLLSSAVQLTLRLQRYLLSVSEQSSSERSSSPADAAASPWAGAFRLYCKQLAALCTSLLSSNADRIASKPGIALLVSSALTGQATGVLLPSLLTCLRSRPADMQALAGCFLPLLQQLDRLNVAAHASPPLLSSELCLSAATMLAPLPSQFPSTSLESPHPYTAGTIDRQLTLPSSLCVAVDFSDLCCSRNANDALKLSQSDGWSLVCSGGAAGMGAGTGRGWPRWMVRRRGQEVAIYWQVEASKSEARDSNRSHGHHTGNDWGWAVKLYGFSPHPLPRMKCDGMERDLDALFDLEMSAITALSRSVRPSLVSADSRILNGAEEWDEQPGLPYPSTAEEDDVASKVNLSLLSAGLAAGRAERGSDVDEQRQLLGELLLAFNGSSSHAHAQSHVHAQLLPTARLLLEVLSSNISGRPAMPAAMRRIVQPVEAAVLGCFLVHSNLLPTAAALLRTLQVQRPRSSVFTGDTAFSSSTAPPPHPPLATGPAAHQRLLTDTQCALLAALTPIVRSGLYRVISWLLHRAQLDKRWRLLVEDTAEHILAHQQQQQQQQQRQRDERDKVEHIPAHGVTVQSLLLAAAASNRAPPPHLPSDLDTFIRDRLSVVSADDLRQLATTNRVHLRDAAIDVCVAQLVDIVRKCAVEAAKVLENPTTVRRAAGSLEDLAVRLYSMAAFLCEFRPAAQVKSVSSDELISALCGFLFASCSSVTPASLSAVLKARIARSRHRALAYGSLAAALPSIRVPSSRDALLASLPHRPALVDDLQGCSEADIDAVYERYRELLDAIQVSVKVDPATPPSAVSIDCLLHHAKALTFTSSVTPLPLVSYVVDSLVSLHRTLSPHVALLVNPILPPLSSTLLFSSSPSAPPLCSYVLTDSNHTDLAIYCCKTCGFTDGKVICASCARSCHAGHDVCLMKQGAAFCDCWLFSGDKCAGMHWSTAGRQRQQLQSRLDDCRVSAADLITRVMEAQCDQSAQERLRLQLRLLQYISEQAERCEETLDDELLHSLLSCAFRVRSHLAFIEVPLDASLGTSGVPCSPLLSAFCSFAGVLLRIWSTSSLRCQRLALRLLTHFIRRTTPSQWATCSLPTSFPSSVPCELPVSAVERTSALLLTALFTSVGNAVLHSSYTQHEAAKRPVQQSTDDSSDGDASGAMDVLDGRTDSSPSTTAAESCVLLLCRPSIPQLTSAPDSPATFPNTSVSSFVSSFVDRCSVDVLHYHHIQSLLDATTSADRPLAPPPPASTGESGKAQLDSVYRRQVSKQLHDTGEATVFEGQRHLCEELGTKLAAHGLSLRVEVQSESAGQVKNTDAIARHRATQGWQRRRMSGRQSLCVASEVIVLIRTLLLSADCTAAWHDLTERSVSSLLPYLSSDWSPLHADGLVVSWRVELSASIGALAVVTGSTGYDLPTLGAVVRVTNRDSPLEELSNALPIPQHTGAPSPLSPTTPASAIASSLCNPFCQGRLVYVDESGSETRVVRDGDARRAGERVHWTRLCASLPAEIDETALLASSRLAELRLSMLDSAVNALTALASAHSQDEPAVFRSVHAMLHARLLRLVLLLVADRDVALQLLTRHAAVLSKVVLAALSPAVTVELRTVIMELSRAMELQGDFILDHQLERRRTSGQRAVHQPSPAGWRRDTALRCLLTDNDCCVVYSGISSNPVKRMKVNIDELLPTLLTADRPWLLPSPTTSTTPPSTPSPLSHYFEVSLLTDCSSLSVGVCPLALPLSALTSPRSSASSHSFLSSPSPISVPTSSSAHLFGWPEGSIVYCNDGSKARFWHAVKVCSASRLHVHDLVDVRDSAAGKWQQAIVAAETDDTVRIHYLQWDEKCDEEMPRDSDRLDTFLSRTRYINRTSAEQRAVTGQLWREASYAQSFGRGDVVGCGYNQQAGGVFFTLNGRYLGVAYRQHIASRLLPAVCLHNSDTKIVKANFIGPFLYQAGPELSECAADSDDGQPSMDGGEAMWADGGGSDISSSLRLFNEPTHTSAAHVVQRIVPWLPLPSADLYRRHELADEMRQSGLFPDLTLAQLLLALERSEDDLQRAMELAYCQSSLLILPAVDADRSTPVAPLFSPAPRTMFPTTPSAASSSSFFSGPFNSTPPSTRGPRVSSVSSTPMQRRPGLLSASSTHSFLPASSSSLSPSSSAAADEDGFDDFLFDDDTLRSGMSGSSVSPPPLHSSSHAYALDSLSSGARSVNQFYASESADLQFSRTNRATEGGDGSGDRLLPFDIPPQSALDVLQLLESIRRPSHDTGVLDVLQQLRQLSSSSEALLFLAGNRTANSSDGAGGLFVMSGQPAPAPPAAISQNECVVGATVRISVNCKSVCIGSLPSSGRRAVLWCDEMNDLIGRVGVITAVDWRLGLARVRCVDHERSIAKELWWPPAALNCLITLRRRVYVAGNHPLVILPHLINLNHKLVRHMSRQLLLALMQHVAQLTTQVAVEQDGAMVRLKAATNPSPGDDEGNSGNGMNWRTSLSHTVPLLARDILIVWSLRSLHGFISFEGPSIVHPPVPYTEQSCGGSREDEQPGVRLLTSVSSQHPQLAIQCLRHAQHMLAQSVEVEYHGNQTPLRQPASTPSPTPLSHSTATLMYRTVHVPYASCLVVTFVSVSVAPGGLLSFYGSAHHQRLLLQIRGQRGARSPVPQSPFVVPSNTVWIALTVDTSTGLHTSADSSNAVRLLVCPVSEQLSAGLWLAQHQLSVRQHSDYLRPLYDACVELLVSPAHAPAVLRVPVLRLTVAVIRSSPRGSLSDFQSALPLFREMLNLRSASERDLQNATERRTDSSRRDQPQLCSRLMQLLFELHCAIVAHFHSPHTSSALASTAASHHSQLSHLSRELSEAPYDDELKEEEERKMKNDEELQAETEVQSQWSASRRLSHYLTAEKERLSSPLGLGDSEADVALDSEFSFPQWFVDGCSVLLSFRGVLLGEQWMIAAATRRRTSSIAVVTADGRADVALPTYGPWRSGADWFDDSEQQQQQLVARRCLPLATYEQLAAYMGKRAQQLGKSAVSLTRADVVEDESFPSRYPLLRSLPTAALLYAATSIQSLNALLSDSFPLFDLSGSSTHSGLLFSHPTSDSPLALFTRCRGLLFSSTVLSFFHSVLSATSIPSSSVPTPHLRINRLKAAQSLSAATVSELSGDRQKDAVSLLSDSLLGQTYKQLKGVAAAALRRPRGRGGAPHVAFNVQFEGESVLGQGGPYRELFNDLSVELQSQQLPCPLFVPTPNQRHQLGEQRHLYMPNPSATSPAQLELYEHIGRLMAVACRTRVLLSLDLPTLFWKQLAAEAVGIDDLREVDTGLVDGVLLPSLECASEDDLDRFGSSSLTFPVTRSDQTPVLPTPGGSPVTLDTLSLYAQQLLETRLSECRQQVEAIRRGMSELLPVALFPLMSPADLSTLFCGSPSIDVDLLLRHTEYSGGLTAGTRHIEWFWSCLREMSEEQRRQFVHFAYAQQRLPGDDSGFDTFPKLRMLIKPVRGGDGDVDSLLPHSDTCFFNLELPAYSSRAIMQQRLLQACEMGQWGLSGDDGALHDAVLQADLAATHSAHSSPPLPPPLPERRGSDTGGTGNRSTHISSSGSMGTEMHAMNTSSASLSSLSSPTTPFSSLSSPTAAAGLSGRLSARATLSAAGSTDGAVLRGDLSSATSSPDAPTSASSSSSSASSYNSSSALSASSFGSALTSSFRSFFSRSSPSSSSAFSLLSSRASPASSLHSSSQSSSQPSSSSVVGGRDFSPTSFADSLLDAHSGQAARRRSHDLD